jgi:hypothetical protein
VFIVWKMITDQGSRRENLQQDFGKPHWGEIQFSRSPPNVVTPASRKQETGSKSKRQEKRRKVGNKEKG